MTVTILLRGPYDALASRARASLPLASGHSRHIICHLPPPPCFAMLHNDLLTLSNDGAHTSQSGHRVQGLTSYRGAHVKSDLAASRIAAPLGVDSGGLITSNLASISSSSKLGDSAHTPRSKTAVSHSGRSSAMW